MKKKNDRRRSEMAIGKWRSGSPRSVDYRGGGGGFKTIRDFRNDIGFLVLLASSVSLGVRNHWTMSSARRLVCSRVIKPAASFPSSAAGSVTATAVSDLWAPARACCHWYCRLYAKYARANSWLSSSASKSPPMCTMHAFTLLWNLAASSRHATAAGFQSKVGVTVAAPLCSDGPLSFGAGPRGGGGSGRASRRAALLPSFSSPWGDRPGHSPSSIRWASIVHSVHVFCFSLYSWYFLTTGFCWWKEKINCYCIDNDLKNWQKLYFISFFISR